MKRRGLSLTEVLIALFLLGIAFGGLVVTFQGAGKETAFSAEHYTAMFLAQKVIEDLNGQLRHNPHVFSALIAQGDGNPEPVIDGRSPFFRLLENTQNFGFLSEADDEPLREGPLFEQLKPFTLQVSTSFVEDPVTGEGRANLVRVTAIVRWTTREGQPKEYRVSQLVYGIPDDAYQTLPDITLTPSAQALLDAEGLVYLIGLFGVAPGTTMDALAATIPGANVVVLTNLGRVGHLFNLGEQIEQEYKQRLNPLEDERDDLRNSNQLPDQLRFADLQRQIAELYEQKAVKQLASLMMVKKPLTDLVETVEGYPPNLLTSLSEQYKGYVKRIHQTVDKVFMTIRYIPMSLSTAESIYLKLVNPPCLERIPRGREAAIFRKVLDIQKLGILRHRQDADAVPLLAGLKSSIVSFREKFTGRFPQFLVYLAKEEQDATTLATLRAQYKGIYDAFGLIDDLDELVGRLKKAMPLPKEKK